MIGAPGAPVAGKVSTFPPREPLPELTNWGRIRQRKQGFAGTLCSKNSFRRGCNFGEKNENRTHFKTLGGEPALSYGGLRGAICGERQNTQVMVTQTLLDEQAGHRRV